MVSLSHLFTVAMLFVADSPASAPILEAGFAAIERPDLEGWLGFLASEELEGRASGSRGYDVACRFAASILAGLGLEPGGREGTYFQPFVLLEREWRFADAVLTLKTTGGDPERIPLDGQVGVAGGRDIRWSAPWVFAGFGEGADRDAPDDFHGLSVSDSVVLVVPPEGRTGHEHMGAVAAGARRIVVVSDRRVRRGRKRLPALPAYRLREPEVEIVYLTTQVADRILSHFGTSVGEVRAAGTRPRRFELSGLDIELVVPLETRERPTRNVVAVLEGADPTLRDEAVVVGAHLDHVGLQGGSLHPGADDNASGSCVVLSTAKAFARGGLRPRRSVVFCLFAAEEVGLHGSRFFVDHPVRFRAQDIVLMVNLDMVGRNEGGAFGNDQKPEDNELSIHPVGARRLSLELEPWIRRLNGGIGLQLEVGEDGEERVFERSDQISFARHGVPVVFFFAGFHPDYHRPADTADKINFDKVERVARLTFALAFEVADRPRRLTVNRF